MRPAAVHVPQPYLEHLFYNFTPEQEASARAQLFEKGIYEGAFQNNEKLVRAAGELFVGSEEYGWVALNFVQGRLVVEKHSGRRCRSIGTEVTNVVAKSDGIIRRLELVDGYPAWCRASMWPRARCLSAV